MRITLKMFRCPPQNCTIEEYLSHPFPKPSRNVFTILCNIKSLLWGWKKKSWKQQQSTTSLLLFCRSSAALFDATAETFFGQLSRHSLIIQGTNRRRKVSPASSSSSSFIQSCFSQTSPNTKHPLGTNSTAHTKHISKGRYPKSKMRGEEMNTCSQSKFLGKEDMHESDETNYMPLGRTQIQPRILESIEKGAKAILNAQ